MQHNLEAYRALTGISFDAMKSRLAAALLRRWEAGKARNEAIRLDQIRPDPQRIGDPRPDLWQDYEIFPGGRIVERNGAARVESLLPTELLDLTERAEAAAADAERELAETRAAIDRENAAVLAEQAEALAKLCGRDVAAQALHKAADRIAKQ